MQNVTFCGHSGKCFDFAVYKCFSRGLVIFLAGPEARLVLLQTRRVSCFARCAFLDVKGGDMSHTKEGGGIYSESTTFQLTKVTFCKMLQSVHKLNVFSNSSLRVQS